MAADYQGYQLFTRTVIGEPVPLPAGVTVKVRLKDAVSDSASSPLTTNSDGEIEAGTISDAAPGDIAYFRIENYEGLASSVAQILT